MKILNAHTQENWETVYVSLNGFMLALPVFPLRAKGQGSNRKPKAAFFGDPDNLDKLWFVVLIGTRTNEAFFSPYEIIEPNTSSGQATISALYDEEQRYYEELPCEKENRELRQQLQRIEHKLRKTKHLPK